MIRYDVCKKNPYGNWKVYNVDGQLIFRCGDKKANWYLNHNLANLLSNDEIKLNFVTKGVGNVDNEYLLEDKKNMCVVCGYTQDLTRHHIVPYFYRKYFPKNLKCKSPYDVVVLCFDCHGKYEKDAHQLKLDIAKEYNTGPLYTPVLVDEEKRHVTKVAYAVKVHGDKIPFKRLFELENRLKSYLGKDELTKQDIEDLCNVEWYQKSDTNHGQEVVSKLQDINAFILRWRKHFLDCTKPQHLSKLWKIDYIKD